MHLDWRRAVKLNVAQFDGDGVIDVGVEGGNGLCHQLFRAELQDLIGHINPVDLGTVGAQTGSSPRVARVFNDDRGIAAIHEGGLGVAPVGIAAADQDTK